MVQVSVTEKSSLSLGVFTVTLMRWESWTGAGLPCGGASPLLAMVGSRRPRSVGTQLGDGNGRPRSSFWAVMKVEKVSTKKAWDLKVRELECSQVGALKSLG